ncbi:MAG TPA: hypothetical protein VGS41_04340, partial [Chthonomonadales bacterium]|nr:hypothetical protein [Chthonomonadales bacterium]
MESATADRCSWCNRSLSDPEPQAKALSPDEPAKEVEDAGAELKTPWSNAPAPVPPAEAPAQSPSSESSHPIIAVRRPGGASAGPQMAPIPRSGAHSAGSAGGPDQPRGSGTAVARPQRVAPVAPIPRHAYPAKPASQLGGGISAPAVTPSMRAGAQPAVDAAVPPVAAPAAPPAAPLTAATGAAAPLAPPDAQEHAPVLSPQSRAQEATDMAGDLHVPALGTFTAAKSRYYPGQVVDPVSGTHYDSDSGRPTSASDAAATPDTVRTAAILPETFHETSAATL